MKLPWLPIAHWISQYSALLLRFDVIAGITLAFFVMPESLAYASLAGVPPQYGIYCCLAGGLVFAVLTTARQVAVGPTSAISLMIGTAVAGMAMGDPARWLAITELTALCVGVLCLLAYVLRLSAIVNFISENILLGFKAGAALSIATTQLPKLFGVEGGGGHFFQRLYDLALAIPHTNSTTLIIGVAAFTILVLGTRLFPGKPVSLVVLGVSIILMSTTSLATHGVQLVGHIQSGLPTVGRPGLRFMDVDGVLGLALACFLMSYIETVSAAKAFAQKHNYVVNPRQELLSLGVANIASAIAGGFVVAGGLSQSTVNDKAGARTPMALLICSATLAGLLFFTDLLAALPEVVLAAIVLDAILGLIKINDMKRLYRLSRSEFAITITALLCVLTFGILKGVLLAAVVSITMIVVRAANPPVVIIGRVRNSNVFSELTSPSDSETFEGLMIVRVDSSIIYFNVENIKQQIMRLVHESATPVRTVILNLASSPHVDVAGSRMLRDLSTQFNDAGILLQIVEARYRVRELLYKQGMEAYVGPLDRSLTCSEAVEAFIEQSATTSNSEPVV